MNFDDIDPNIKAIIEEWDKDPYVQELLSKIGSDYDENGIPYWEK